MPKISNRDARAFIVNRRPFESHTGSFWGRWFPTPGHIPTGRLPRGWVEVLDSLPSDPVYVVYSYGTPIGWASEGELLTVPDVKYSRTTSGHQSVVHWAAQG